MAERYHAMSLYVYCMNNPMKYVDPDGCSTWVIQDDDGTYRVVGGNLDDNDLNIYLIRGFKDAKSLSETGKTETSIGFTTSITSVKHGFTSS